MFGDGTTTFGKPSSVIVGVGWGWEGGEGNAESVDPPLRGEDFASRGSRHRPSLIPPSGKYPWVPLGSPSVSLIRQFRLHRSAVMHYDDQPILSLDICKLLVPESPGLGQALK